MGIGVKDKINISIATKAIHFLFASNVTISFNGGGCLLPKIKTIRKAKKIHAGYNIPNPIIKTSVPQLAYFCFSPRTAREICPPSNCPAGNKFMAVTNKPTHPAKAVGWSMTVEPGGIWINILVNNINKGGSPKTGVPEGMSVRGVSVDIVNPIIIIGIATKNPQIGPAAPMSRSAFRSGMGSFMDMNAPIVPKGNIGFGGIGIKKGSDGVNLCLLEIK